MTTVRMIQVFASLMALSVLFGMMYTMDTRKLVRTASRVIRICQIPMAIWFSIIARSNPQQKNQNKKKKQQELLNKSLI